MQGTSQQNNTKKLIKPNFGKPKSKENLVVPKIPQMVPKKPSKSQFKYNRDPNKMPASNDIKILDCIQTENPVTEVNEHSSSIGKAKVSQYDNFNKKNISLERFTQMSSAHLEPIIPKNDEIIIPAPPEGFFNPTEEQLKRLNETGDLEDDETIYDNEEIMKIYNECFNGYKKEILRKNIEQCEHIFLKIDFVPRSFIKRISEKNKKYIGPLNEKLKHDLYNFTNEYIASLKGKEEEKDLIKQERERKKAERELAKQVRDLTKEEKAEERRERAIAKAELEAEREKTRQEKALARAEKEKQKELTDIKKLKVKATKKFIEEPTKSPSIDLEQEHENILMEILDLLSIDRANNCEKSVQLATALKNMKNGTFEIYDSFLRKSSEYNSFGNVKSIIWDKIKPSGFGYNQYSILKWAKEDNPELYIEFKNKYFPKKPKFPEYDINDKYYFFDYKTTFMKKKYKTVQEAYNDMLPHISRIMRRVGKCIFIKESDENPFEPYKFSATNFVDKMYGDCKCFTEEVDMFGNPIKPPIFFTILNNSNLLSRKLDYIPFHSDKKSDIKISECFNTFQGLNASIVDLDLDSPLVVNPYNERINKDWYDKYIKTVSENPQIYNKRYVVNFFLNHIKNIFCRGNEIHYRYFLKLIQLKVGELIRLCICIILKGEPGCGKSMFIEFLKEFIFSNKMFKTVSSINAITQKHNSILKETMFISVNETNSGEKFNKGDWDIFKDLITAPTISIEPKGIDIFQIANHSDFIICTNHDYGVCVEKGDRRDFILDCSNEKVGDKPYFDEFFTICMNQQFGDLFYSILRSDQFKIDYELANIDINIPPMTKLKEDIIKNSQPKINLFVEDYFYNSLIENDKGEIIEVPHTEYTIPIENLYLSVDKTPYFKISDLYNLYLDWHQKTNNGFKLSQVKFKDYLINQNSSLFELIPKNIKVVNAKDKDNDKKFIPYKGLIKILTTDVVISESLIDKLSHLSSYLK